MSTILWAAGDRPAIGSMAVSTLLDDNAAGDTTTFHHITQTVTGSTTVSCHIDQTAVIDLGTVQPLMGWTATVGYQADTIDETVYGAINVEYLDGNSQWQSLATMPMQFLSAWITKSQNGLTVSTRYLRLVFAFDGVVPSGPHTFDARLSDFRLTTIPVVSCPVPVPPKLTAESTFVGGVGTIILKGS